MEPTIDPATIDSAPAGPRTFGEWLRDMPRWKQLAVAAAVVAVVASGILSMSADAPATSPSGNVPSGSMSGLSASLAADPPAAGTPPQEEPAAKGVFRLGFSFLAGFCIGSFLRATLRIAAIAFGFWLFLTTVLAYYGILVVDLNAMGSLWDRFAANVAQEWGNYQRFLTGSLPAAGLAVAGLAIGLKRH